MIVAVKKIRKLHLLFSFLNIEISLNFLCTCLKIGIHVLNGIIEGTVSQIFYLGPRIYFM